MADPISLFPLFVRNQAYPPSGGTGTTMVEKISVTVKEEETELTHGPDAVGLVHESDPARVAVQSDAAGVTHQPGTIRVTVQE